MASSTRAQTLRKYHRYLGYFLSGIVLLYASSGVLLIFRKTDFLKFDHHFERQLSPGLQPLALLSELSVKGLAVEGVSDGKVMLNMGQYDVATGQATLTTKEYPAAIDKVVHMHKATTKSPLYFLNIVFGLSLMFFAVSAFFIFPPKATALTTGMKVASAGFLMALLFVFLG